MFRLLLRRGGLIQGRRYYSTENVDKTEVDNLARMAAEWWDSTGHIKALHSMNALRVPLIRDGLISTNIIPPKQIGTPRVLENVQILDVGCGGGILSEALARLHAQVTGIDAGEELVKVAEVHAAQDQEISARIEYKVTTIEDHAQTKPEFYDAVVASEVLEHVNDKSSFLDACVLALKPGGSIFITTLNKTNLSWFGGVLVAENLLHLVPPNTHNWDKFVSPEEVQTILGQLRCRTLLVHGMRYEFWRDTWSWSRFTPINYAIQAVKEAS